MPPIFDPAKCSGCASCVFECGHDCIEFDLRRHLPRLRKEKGRDCVNCFICQENCPTGAIRMVLGRRQRRQ